jgi:hypothetical protein
MTRFVFGCALATLIAVGSHHARAQTPRSVRVDVSVRDTSGRPIGGAEVAVVRGLNDARASGQTDDRGRLSLVAGQVVAAQDDYHLVVRKIGFERTERFFHPTRDTLGFDIVIQRVAQELSPVVVTAEQDLKRKSYHIDADAIANSDRTLIDATDILTKLRPDMICGRSCSPLGAVAATTRTAARKCPMLALQQKSVCPVDNTPPSVATNVWVNGRWIRSIIPSEMAMARRTGMLAGLLPGSLTVLSEIKPEHIAEMTYLDEFDNTVGKVGSQSALFIVLKNGINYEPGKESYVVDEAIATPAPAPTALPAYRYRLLGVYDDSTGDPIEGAYVIDMTSGTKARTTATGTVSLGFLSEGTSPVRITKAGYEDLTLAVEISAEAKLPLTLVMVRRPK